MSGERGSHPDLVTCVYCRAGTSGERGSDHALLSVVELLERVGCLESVVATIVYCLL